MSRIGTNRRGRPSKKSRSRVRFKTGLPVLDELYKMIWQYGIQNLAAETGVSESTLQGWTQGDTIPNIKKAQQVLDYLGYELLIFEKDEPFEQEE